MAYEAEFDMWWSGCWLKVGKLAAKREYDKARRSHGATAEELIAGRDAYAAHKPSWQEWAHPKTWLHQGRWMDQWEQAVVTLQRHWSEECTELHGGTCVKRWDHEMRKKASA